MAVPEPTVKAGAQLVGAPVAASKTAKFRRVSSPWPSGDPAGRMLVNVPPTNTRPPAEATDHATPLVCHVVRSTAEKRAGAWTACARSRSGRLPTATRSCAAGC